MRALAVVGVVLVAVAWVFIAWLIVSRALHRRGWARAQARAVWAPELGCDGTRTRVSVVKVAIYGEQTRVLARREVAMLPARGVNAPSAESERWLNAVGEAQALAAELNEMEGAMRR
jgi:hypothetical protein